MKQIGILLLVLFTHSAAASLITLQSININNQFTLADGQTFANYWHANAVGDNAPETVSLNEFSDFRTGKDTLNLLSIELSAFQSSVTFDLFAALDAHYGIEAYFNGARVFSQYRDFWWQRNWDHSAVIRLLNLALLSGLNTLELYWAERCCDGPNSVKFAFDNGTPTYLGEIALTQAMAVSSPAALPVWLLGVFGLFVITGRKNVKNPDYMQNENKVNKHQASKSLQHVKANIRA